MLKSTSEKYDSIIIGASPLAILEALYLNALGQRVAIISDSDTIGGAWRTIQHPGLPPLEIGCHIWDNNAEVQQFLIDYLGLNITPFVPSPIIQYGRFSFPYDWKYFILDLKAFLKKIKPISNHDLVSYSLIPKKYYYPQRGSTELIEKLDAKLKETNIEIIFDTYINTIDIINDHSIRLITNDGQTYSCQKIVVTGLSRINEFINGGNLIKLDTPRKVDFIHAHLVFKDDTPVNFSYIRVHKHSHIHRVSDITYQMSPKSFKNKRLIMVGIFDRKYYETDKSKLQKIILNYLMKNKFIGKQAKMEDIHWNIYPTSYVIRDNFEKIIEPIENIYFIQSDSIIPGIAKQLNRWKNLLHPTQQPYVHDKITFGIADKDEFLVR